MEEIHKKQLKAAIKQKILEFLKEEKSYNRSRFEQKETNFIAGRVGNKELSLKIKRPDDIENYNNVKEDVVKTIRHFMGDEVYDKWEEKYKKNSENMEINSTVIANAGTLYMGEGLNVLQFHAGGTGQAMPSKLEKGLYGLDEASLNMHGTIRIGTGENTKTFQIDSHMIYDLIYGEKIADGVRYQSTSFKETGAKKVEYNLSGPGMFNTSDGEDSLTTDSIERNILNYGRDYIAKEYEIYQNNKDSYKGCVIMLQGFSRGAVGISMGTTALRKYINDTYGNDEEFLDKVHFDMILNDPIPGNMMTSKYEKMDIRSKEFFANEQHPNHFKVFNNKSRGHKYAPLTKNDQSTVFYSLNSGHNILPFEPEEVRGAKRIILKTHEHVTMENNISMEDKKHREAYTDAKTGKLYRESGISFLPEGIYIVDENNVLIDLKNTENATTILRRLLYGDVNKKNTGYFTEDPRHQSLFKMIREHYQDHGIVNEDPQSTQTKAEILNDWENVEKDEAFLNGYKEEYKDARRNHYKLKKTYDQKKLIHDHSFPIAYEHKKEAFPAQDIPVAQENVIRSSASENMIYTGTKEKASNTSANENMIHTSTKENVRKDSIASSQSLELEEDLSSEIEEEFNQMVYSNRIVSFESIKLLENEFEKIVKKGFSATDKKRKSKVYKTLKYTIKVFLDELRAVIQDTYGNNGKCREKISYDFRRAARLEQLYSQLMTANENYLAAHRGEENRKDRVKAAKMLKDQMEGGYIFTFFQQFLPALNAAENAVHTPERASGIEDLHTMNTTLSLIRSNGSAQEYRLNESQLLHYIGEHDIQRSRIHFKNSKKKNPKAKEEEQKALKNQALINIKEVNGKLNARDANEVDSINSSENKKAMNSINSFENKKAMNSINSFENKKAMNSINSFENNNAPEIYSLTLAEIAAGFVTLNSEIVREIAAKEKASNLSEKAEDLKQSKLSEREENLKQRKSDQVEKGKEQKSSILFEKDKNLKLSESDQVEKGKEQKGSILSEKDENNEDNSKPSMQERLNALIEGLEDLSIDDQYRFAGIIATFYMENFNKVYSEYTKCKTKEDIKKVDQSDAACNCRAINHILAKEYENKPIISKISNIIHSMKMHQNDVNNTKSKKRVG